MSKLVAGGASAGVLGTGGAATLGAHYMGAFGSSSTEVTDSTPKLDSVNSRHSNTAQIGTTVKDFRNYGGGHCIAHTFPGAWFSDGQISNAEAKLDEVQANTTTLGTGDVRGCLVSNREKYQNTETNEWQGNFRFAWTLSRGKHGFMVYMTGDHKGDKTMVWDGVAYVFENKNGGWRATHTMAMKEESKKVSSTDLTKYFPMIDEDVFGHAPNFEDDGFWNFVKESGEINPEGDTEDTMEEYWHWTSGDGSHDQEIGKWSSNMNTWWKHFFDEPKWKMLDIVKGIKGRWWRS